MSLRAPSEQSDNDELLRFTLDFLQPFVERIIARSNGTYEEKMGEIHVFLHNVYAEYELMRPALKDLSGEQLFGLLAFRRSFSDTLTVVFKQSYHFN